MNSTPGVIVIEGHIQGLSNTRSIGEYGIPVVVIDKHNCIARYSKYCTKFYKCPNYNTQDFIEFLLYLGINFNYKNWLLLPSNDHAVLAIAKHKVLLEKIFKIITPELEVINNIYNKSLLLNIAQNLNIPIPATYYLENKIGINEIKNYPVLIKGKQGLDFYKSLKQKAFLAYDKKELQLHINNIDEKLPLSKIFIQELIPDVGNNKTISFCPFCINGEIKTFWMGIKLREHPIRFGTATFAKSVYIKECHDQSVPLLKSLNYTGVCEIEYLLDPRDNKYKLIEINARTWLWVGLAKECGVNFAKIIYDYMNKKDIIYPDKYELEYYWINPVTDLFYTFIGIFKGKVNLKNYYKSLHNKKISNAIFKKNDTMPAIYYTINIIKYKYNR